MICAFKEQVGQKAFAKGNGKQRQIPCPGLPATGLGAHSVGTSAERGNLVLWEWCDFKEGRG
jgi:hypothetical protein